MILKDQKVTKLSEFLSLKACALPITTTTPERPVTVHILQDTNDEPKEVTIRKKNPDSCELSRDPFVHRRPAEERKAQR